MTAGKTIPIDGVREVGAQPGLRVVDPKAEAVHQSSA